MGRRIDQKQTNESPGVALLNVEDQHVEIADHYRKHPPHESGRQGGAVGYGTSQIPPTFEVEVLDLRDWPLPIFAEHFGTVGDFNDPTYSVPIVRQ